MEWPCRARLLEESILLSIYCYLVRNSAILSNFYTLVASNAYSVLL